MSEKPSQIERDVDLETAKSQDRELVTVARDWLERARCPDCSGSGWIVGMGADGPFREGCEWCYIKHLVLSPCR